MRGHFRGGFIHLQESFSMKRFLDPNAAGGVSTAPTQAPAPAAVTQAAAQPQTPAVQPTAPPPDPVDRILQRLDAQLEPVLTRISAIEQQVQQAAQTPATVPPQRQTQGAPSLLYAAGGPAGSAPGIRQGEDTMGSRGFLMQKASLLTQGEIGPEDARLEAEYSQFLMRAYQSQGFRKAGKGSNTMLFPIWGQAIQPQIMGDLNQKFGDYYQLMAAGVAGAGNDGASLIQHACRQQGIDMDSADGRSIRQALSIFDDSALGIFTRPGPKGEFIALLRAAEILSRAGASQVALPPNGYLNYGKQTGASSAYWVGENQPITTSEPTTGDMELRARKLACRINTPNELLMFGGSDVELLMRADMTIAMALKYDLAGFEGTGGTYQPLGLLNRSGVQVHTRSLTVDTNGDTFEPDSPGAMISDLAEQNHSPEEASCNWVMRPRMWWDNILQRRADAVAEDDGAGPFLFRVNEDIAANRPGRMHGKNVLTSTQVSGARVKGTGSDLTYVMLGIFRHVMLARIGVIEFATQVEGDTVFANYQTGLRAVQHVDIGVRYENAFTYADKIDMDLM
jgi:HK97 family phage major capsid protein